jgi:hypothetical protein
MDKTQSVPTIFISWRKSMMHAIPNSPVLKFRVALSHQL